MSFLQKLFFRKPTTPTTRVRVCVECGMPVESHANWCAILRTQQEMDLKRAQREAKVEGSQGLRVEESQG
jgi:hypothetical protein